MFLERNNGKLYYEVSGHGEALLLIHGAIVDAGFYQETSRILSQYFQVICYDRRGYSRSKVKQPDKIQMDDQANDILDIMEALGLQKIIVAGASAGAVIGQYFQEKYPEKVKHLIMYEPAMLGHMMLVDPEFPKWAEKVKNLIQKRKYNMALLAFAQHIGPADPRSPEKEKEVSRREFENVEFTFSTDIPELVAYVPNLEKMRKEKNKITIAVGERSKGTAYFKESKKLAELIGKQVVYYPGGHNLPYDLPVEFAISVIGTLATQWKGED